MKGSPMDNRGGFTCEEISLERRVDVDVNTTVAAMALTAKKMNSKYKETSEGAWLVLG
jgi:L-serine deaminase